MRGSRIAILGVSYKAGVGDLRESPALKIMKLLAGAGRRARYHDPYVPELAEFGLSVGAARRMRSRSCDVAVIVTAHPDLDLDIVAERAPLIVDFRGVTIGKCARDVVRL